MLRSDGTTDCDACHMPMFPSRVGDGAVRLECANRHHTTTPLPRDAGLRRTVENWVARRGAQLHAQHERWGTDDEEDDNDGRR